MGVFAISVHSGNGWLFGRETLKRDGGHENERLVFKPAFFRGLRFKMPGNHILPNGGLI